MKALVTGGGGFLGSSLVRKLVERGDTVVAFQRGRYDFLEELGVECHQFQSMELMHSPQWLVALTAAASECDIVFHTAAKAGVWGDRELYRNANEVYTSVVINAGLDAGVRGLVHTSSPSVVFRGCDEDGVDESLAYPDRYLAAYPRTKAAAERIVLRHADELPVTLLRPHLIWGPGDRHLVPRIIQRAKVGKLKLVGDGSNVVDSTYIDNAVHAHLLAADQLLDKGADAPCAGKTYFISNGEPLAMKELINKILGAAGMEPVHKSVSPRVAYAAGALLEGVYKLFRIRREPIMTRFVAKQLSCAHWYDLSAAKRDLNYEPLVSIDEGMKRLAAWLSELPI